MTNPLNNGVLTGRLAGAVRTFDNKDGSKSIHFTIFADRNFKNRTTGERDSDAIEVRAFIPSGAKSVGPYGLIDKGSRVAVAYELRSSRYTDASGKEVYAQTVEVQDISLLDTRGEAEARRLSQLEAENAQLREQVTTPVQPAAPTQPIGEDLPFSG